MEDRLMMIEKDIKVNCYDIDAMGIVSNIVYIRWFEDLRFAFLEKYYSYAEMMEIQLSPILMKTEVEYKAPLTIFDNVIGRCWITNMSKGKWEMEFEIISNDKLHCTGRQSGCFYDMARKRPTLIPRILLDQYKEENQHNGVNEYNSCLCD